MKDSLMLALLVGAFVFAAYLSGWLFSAVHKMLAGHEVSSIHRISWVLVLGWLLQFGFPAVALVTLIVGGSGRPPEKLVIEVSLFSLLWMLLLAVLNPYLIRKLVPTEAGEMRLGHAFAGFYAVCIVGAILVAVLKA